MNLNLSKPSYQERSSFDITKVTSNLPIFNHISKEEMTNPGTKPWVLNFSKILFILTLIAAGYITWVYILPIVGVMLQAFVAIFFVGVVLLARNSIFSLMKSIARKIDKLAIEQDPILTLKRSRTKIVESKQKFIQAVDSIFRLKVSTSQEKEKQAKLAAQYKKEVLESVENLKIIREDLKKFSTAESKETDEYSDLVISLDNESSKAQRNETLYVQSNNLVEKYGMREVSMAKLHRKLKYLGNRVDIKINDFDATVEILERELAFSKSGRRATEEAKKALEFNNTFEVEYAIEFTASSISANLAMIDTNLQDITKISENFSFDNDEIFDKVNILANKFSSGEETPNTGTKYKNPDYKASNSEIERTNSGAFESLL